MGDSQLRGGEFHPVQCSCLNLEVELGFPHQDNVSAVMQGPVNQSNFILLTTVWRNQLLPVHPKVLVGLSVCGNYYF